MKLKRLRTVLLGSFFTLMAVPIVAQDRYPTKPVEIIVPYATGGSVDLVSRMLAEKMSESLGQPVIVVNKSGGRTGLGTSYVAASRPDGYTILMQTMGWCS